MQFTMRFSMDSAAFDEEYPEEEAARILTSAADDLRNGETSGVCRDYNGNRVGGWEITE